MRGGGMRGGREGGVSENKWDRDGEGGGWGREREREREIQLCM